jgi:hypothetical protein
MNTLVKPHNIILSTNVVLKNSIFNHESIDAFSGGPGFIKQVPRVVKKDQSLLTVQRSAHNANMVVQRSILGESAVHTHDIDIVRLSESMEHTVCDGGEGQGQRILCLDGGGIKVNRIRQSWAVVGFTWFSSFPF